MKKHNIILLALISIISFGCKDFLDFEPYGNPQSTDFWKTEKDAINARNALTNWTAREGIDGRGHMWLENCSDNLVTGRPQAEARKIKDFQMSASNGRGWKNNWSRMYETIAIANGILKNVSGMKISKKVKDNVLGEAYFYRAFAYLWLAPWYGDHGINGGIPILTEKTPVDSLDMPRAKSILDNYNMIIADMRKAGELLSPLSGVPATEKGRPHNAAAWGFAARAALYAAQYDAKYFDIVLEMTKKVMDIGGADKRSLYPNFKELFSEKNNFSSEFIYSMFGTAEDGPKFAGMSFQKDGYGIFNTWGYFQPTLELYKAFEKGDKRLKATILYPGEEITYVGNKIEFGIKPEAISSTSSMTFRKWMSPFEPKDAIGKSVSTSGNNQSTRMGLPLLRYADILLMRAEALIWSKGEGNADAVQLLNQIRKRAGLPENSKATKAQLKNERRCELAFEFLPSRFLDLVRWKDYDKLEQPLHGVTMFRKDSNNKLVRIFFGTGKGKLDTVEIWKKRNFNPKINHVFPIPAKDIASSKNLVQNKGY